MVGKSEIKGVIIVVAGIVLTGYLMNALRGQSWMASAISGYDA